MQDFFLSTGIFGLVLLALIVAVVLIWKFRIKRWYVYGLTASINRFPGRLRLRREGNFKWRKADRAEQRMESFHKLGFEDLAGFSSGELPDALVFALRHPITGLIGLVNESQALGTWSDVALFHTGSAQPILASSILKSAHFHFLPGDPKIHKADAPVEELVAAVQTAAGRNFQPRPVDAENFGEILEQAFADATDARLLEPLEDYEIRRLLSDSRAACGDEVSDEEFALLKKLWPVAINNELRLTCGAQFLRETTLSASEWQQAAERLLVVHDRTPLRELAGRLVYGVFLTEPMKKKLRRAKRSGQPREIFARLNDALPAKDRYKKIGTVAKPVPADIYRAPIERPSLS